MVPSANNRGDLTSPFTWSVLYWTWPIALESSATQSTHNRNVLVWPCKRTFGISGSPARGHFAGIDGRAEFLSQQIVPAVWMAARGHDRHGATSCLFTNKARVCVMEIGGNVDVSRQAAPVSDSQCYAAQYGYSACSSKNLRVSTNLMPLSNPKPAISSS